MLNAPDFGLRRRTDNTDAFQKALNAAGQAASGGSTTGFAPHGVYRFTGASIQMPEGVTLQGSYASVTSHQYWGLPSVPPTHGTVLMPTWGRGLIDGTPFLNVSVDCTVRGVVFFYPDQCRLSALDPFTVSMAGNNAAVTDVEFVNAFQESRRSGRTGTTSLESEDSPCTGDWSWTPRTTLVAWKMCIGTRGGARM